MPDFGNLTLPNSHPEKTGGSRDAPPASEGPTPRETARSEPARKKARSASPSRRLRRVDQPVQRLLSHGPETLSEIELVALLLQNGRPGIATLATAAEVLEACGGLRGLLRAGAEELRPAQVGEVRTARILAAVELSRRLARVKIEKPRSLKRPEAAGQYLSLRYGDVGQEILGALYLDARAQLLAEKVIYRGTLTQALVEPQGVMKPALIHSASALILFHTHPSRNPSPSASDFEFTKRIGDAGKILGVQLIDHLILAGPGRWLSFHRMGRIRPPLNGPPSMRKAIDRFQQGITARLPKPPVRALPRAALSHC